MEMSFRPAPGMKGLVYIDQAVKDGTFTPVVGAACSSLESDGEPRSGLLTDIRRKALTLSRFIAKRKDQQASADLAYLQEIVDVDQSQKSTLAPYPVSLEICSLLHALLRLDRLASLSFQHPTASSEAAPAWATYWKRGSDREIHIPRRADDWAVPLVAGDFAKALGDAFTDAIKAADAAYKCQQSKDWDALGLGATAIRDKLTAFRKFLFSSRGPNSQAVLTLPDLLWLSNLLWHVFRFDLKYYPTSAELAFQLSLQVPPEVGYERDLPTLAQAAQALMDPLPVISSWFQYYSKHNNTSQFYSTLAEWLTRTYALQGHNDDAFGTMVSPVILTTNYDNEIENALKARQKPFHILLPVRNTRWSKLQPDTARREVHESLWLIKNMKCRREPNGEIQWFEEWTYGGSSAAYTSSDVDLQDVKDTVAHWDGPLVIKLHGSPLEPLPYKVSEVALIPPRMTNRDDISRLYPRIVVQESDYLLDLKYDLPEQIKKVMSAGNRTLVFLGQSIADWNIRVRLAEHVNWTKPSETGDYDRREQPRFAVNKRVRLFETAFMGPLNIDIINHDLTQIQDRIVKFMPRQ